MRTFLFLLFSVLSTPAFAQLAVETMPGVTNYGGDTQSVEILPGVRHFSGAANGSVIQIAPGLSHYNIQPNLDQELQQSFQAETQWRNQGRIEADRFREQQREWERRFERR